MNLAYVPFKVEEDQVGDAVKGAYALNILGMNVTVPHKQRVMNFCLNWMRMPGPSGQSIPWSGQMKGIKAIIRTAQALAGLLQKLVSE